MVNIEHMEAYGMPIRETTEASCGVELMLRHQELI